MLTQYISWVVLPFLVDKIHDLRRNSFTHSMVRERIVTLCEAGMWERGAGDDRFIVTKQHRFAFMGMPRYHSIVRKSMICSITIRVATNSEP